MRNISLYIAKRYIFSKTNTNAVNIITSIAVGAILVATAALFIILSVFSGLEKMNLKYYSNVNPEIKISPSKGKVLDSLTFVVDQLKQQKEVKAFSKIIEEKVYINYKGKQDIAYLKGVDENFTKVTRLDTVIYGGQYLDYTRADNFIVSNGIAERLQLYIDPITPADLMMPKAGTGLIKQESDAFTSKDAYSVGVFMLNEQYDKHIFTTLRLAQELLLLNQDQCYSIEVKTTGKKSFNEVKNQLQKALGDNYKIETRQDLDSAFLKVMNMENLISYLIFTLVIIIACFNLAGTIIILILDKKKEIQTMYSFGLSRKNIRNIFFQTGFIITFIAMTTGLLIASVIGLLQINFGLVMASATVPFPFLFSVENFIAVIITVLGLGSLVSWIVSRQVK
ncbi:ABC transporter permease [Empedobacter stercoris]|uniref:ABC transporter permease n=1 Tax=Empedobacter stercoris TaxID=1628248 RepID=UPI001CE02C23|nr:FtsX-like permease family protein [Empedobacter stercoris]MCA4776246.1 ABC transporter permease [Empedobacter stercoris]